MTPDPCLYCEVCDRPAPLDSCEPFLGSFVVCQDCRTRAAGGFGDKSGDWHLSLSLQRVMVADAVVGPFMERYTPASVGQFEGMARRAIDAAYGFADYWQRHNEEAPAP